MRVVLAGTPAAALPSLDALAASRHELLAVLTRPSAPAGRGRRPVPSPVEQRGRELGLEVLTPRRLREPGALDRLATLAPDCVPVVAYGQLVPPGVLELPPYGWVNLHFSLLPAWRGAAPVQHALMAGDDVTGATTFRLDEGLDTGPVLGVMTEAVRPDDTAGSLLDRLAVGGARLLVATLDGLEDRTLEPRPQPADGVSLAPRLLPQDARVDWSAPASRVDRLVRGCTPAPGAWTAFRGERLGLGPVRPLPPAAATLAPGEVVAERRRVLVGTATSPVELTEVRPAGRRAMPAPDWARGAHPATGERLG